MVIRSNQITRATIGAAARAAGVRFQSTSEDWYEPIREFTPRRYQYGFEVFLAGKSPRRSAHDRNEYAATWTEWGVFINFLYFVDPAAQIGPYKNREDFRRQTAAAESKTDAEKPWLVRLPLNTAVAMATPKNHIYRFTAE